MISGPLGDLSTQVESGHPGRDPAYELDVVLGHHDSRLRGDSLQQSPERMALVVRKARAGLVEQKNARPSAESDRHLELLLLSVTESVDGDLRLPCEAHQ